MRARFLAILVVAGAAAVVAAAPASGRKPSVRVTLTASVGASPQPVGKAILLAARASTLPKGDRLLVEGRRSTSTTWFAVAQCAGTRCSATHAEPTGIDVAFRARVVARTRGSRGRIVRADARSSAVSVTWEPSVSIADASTPPGGGPTDQTIAFPVQLSARSTKTVTVAYATADGTVKAPNDYTATSGTLTFAPGETSKSIAVPVPGDDPVLGDAATEASETFSVTLSAPANAALAQATATGTILNDDRPTPPTGHYEGTTDQGKSIGFDVAPDLGNVYGVNLGFSDWCTGPYHPFLVRDDYVQVNVPFQLDQTAWSFDASPSATYPDGMVATVRISGTIGLDGKASGQVDVTLTGRHFDGGPVNCDSGTVAWSASPGPPPP